ncbi:MAG: hypothetical protein ACI9MC_001601 [Kiritimatiellia bacterium]|jgi:hypothetical protein
MRARWWILILPVSGCPKVDTSSLANPQFGESRSSMAMTSSSFSTEQAAIPLNGLDSPYEPSTEPPSLEGERFALDLKSLVRSRTDFSLRMDTSVLADLDEKGRDAVMAHFAADPRWRVSEAEETLVAMRRTHREGLWSLPAHGYHMSESETWRVVVRFADWRPDLPWSTSQFVTRVDAKAGEADIHGFVPKLDVWNGQVATALSIDAEHVHLDVFESGDPDVRERTAAALSEIPNTLANVLIRADFFMPRGHDPLLLPPSEPGISTKALTFRSPYSGELEWTARLNPGEPGWIWLRLAYDDDTWEEVAVAAGTKERVGWSPEASEGFYAQATFPVPHGDGFLADAEVWFHPDHGDPRRLLRTEVQVPAR